MDRWKTSPIVGEPIQTGPVYNSCAYGAMEDQVTLYHATSFGNGNYLSTSASCMRDNIRAASKAAGYRLILEGGSITSSFLSGTPFTISLDWKNVGIAPVYGIWDVVYELRDDNTNDLIWKSFSIFNPKLFLPAGSSTTITDHFTLPPTIITGNYKLNVLVKDPINYYAPMPLAIQGKNIDGSYTLSTIALTQNSSTTTASLSGAVNLQGRSTAPNTRWAIPLTIQLYAASTNSLVAEFLNVKTDNYGNFTIHCIPAGTYDITIKNDQMLQRVNFGETLSNGNNIITINTLLAGDATNDNLIDTADLDLIISCYNTKKGELRYNSKADVNGDGYVTILDLSLVLANYNTAGESL